jgi:hypothetical protein
MEVTVTNEYKEVFAQAEIQTNTDDCATVKSPTAIDPHSAVG